MGRSTTPWTAPALIVLTIAAGAVPLSAEKPDVRARLIAPPGGQAGARVTLVVELTLGPHWHVNSHTPAETFLIPTELSLTMSAGTVSAVRYPAQVERRFAFSEKPLRVYEGTVRFEADLEMPANGAESATVAGSLSYQACNEQQCFAPAKMPLDAVVVVIRPPKN